MSQTKSPITVTPQQMRIIFEDLGILPWSHWKDKDLRIWVIVNITEDQIILMHVRSYKVGEQRTFYLASASDFINKVREGVRQQSWAP